MLITVVLFFGLLMVIIGVIKTTVMITEGYFNYRIIEWMRIWFRIDITGFNGCAIFERVIRQLKNSKWSAW